MNIAKKIFAVATSGAIAVASLAAFAGVASAAVHSTGSNVVSNGTVYFLDGTSKRPYTSAGAFLSYGFNSWAGVVAASPEDLALPTGAFVPAADGSLINDKGTVYLITNGQREGFTTAANFLGLGYSFSNVLAGDTSFMTSGPVISSSDIAHPAGTLVNQAGTVYLLTATGKQGIPSLAVFNSWGYSFSKVAPANSYDNALPMSSGIMPTFVLGCLSPLNCTSTGTGTGTGTTTPPVTGNVNVTLSTDSPAGSPTIVAGQASADIGNFTFNGTGTVTSLTFTRLGVSNNSAIDNVYLYEGGTRLTYGSSVTQNNTVSFSNAAGLFTVNGPTEIAVRADLDNNASNISAGQTIGFQLTAGLTGTTAIAGAPVSSNLSSVAVATNLATVTIGSGSTSPYGILPTTGTTVNAGTTNYVLWSAPIQIGQHAATLSTASFEYIGSADPSAFQNWALYLDGAQVATSTGINSSNYVVFTPATAINVNTGSHTLEVHADIIGGSNRNVQLTLQNGSDLLFTDTNYNVGVTPRDSWALSSTFAPVPGGLVGINNGTLSISQDPNFNTTTNIPAGATSTVIGSYQLQAYGENVQVNSLVLTPTLSGVLTTSVTGVAGSVSSATPAVITGTGYNANYAGSTVTMASGAIYTIASASTTSLTLSSAAAVADQGSQTGMTVNALVDGHLQNVSLFLNGSQVGNTQNWTGSGSTINYNFGSSFVVPASSTPSILQIKADLQDNNGANYNVGTVSTSFVIPVGSAQGRTSLQTNTTQDASGAGQSLSIGGSSAVLSLNSALSSSTSVLSNSTNQRIGSYIIQAGSAEGIRLNSLTVSFPSGAGNTLATSYLNNLKVVVSNCSGSTYTSNPVNPQAGSNVFSLSCSIAANSTATVDVYGDPGNFFGYVTTALTVQGQGQVSNNSFTQTVTPGQDIDVLAGSVNNPSLGASTAVSALVASATQPTLGPATTAAFNFVSVNGTSSIQELWVGVYAPNTTNLITGTAPVTQITVSGPGANGTTSTATAPVVSGVAHITGLNIQIPQGNAGQDVAITPTFNFVGINGLATGSGVQFGVQRFKYQSGTSTQDSNVVSPISSVVMSHPMVIAASFPTVANSNGIVGVSSGATFGGGQQVLQFTITANSSGPVRVGQIGITPNYSEAAGDTFAKVSVGSNVVVKIYNISNPSTILNGPSGSGSTFTAGSFASGTQYALQFTTPEVIAAGTSKTYTITVNTTGLAVTGDSFRLDLTNSGTNETYLGAITGTTSINEVYTTSGNTWAWNDATVGSQGLTTEQFLNGYLVQNLPVTGPTFVK